MLDMNRSRSGSATQQDVVKAGSTRFDELLSLLKQAHQSEVHYWEAQVTARMSGNSQCGVRGILSKEGGESQIDVMAGKPQIAVAARRFSKRFSVEFAPSSNETVLIPDADKDRGSVMSVFPSMSSSGGGASHAETSHGSIPTWLFEDVRKQVNRGARSSTAHVFAEACGLANSVFSVTARSTSRPSVGSVAVAPRRLAAFVESSCFDIVCTTAIILDGLLIGWRTHNDARHPSDSVRVHFDITDKIFSLWFLSELCVRFLAEGNLVVFFCTSSKAYWNWFDFALITSDIMELTFEIAIGRSPEEMSNFSVMRMLRILRVCRALRILRLFAFFKELRMMVLSLMLSGRSLFWSMIMLAIIIYLFSIYFIQVTTQHMVHGWDDNQLHRDLKKYCHGLPTLAYYLFQSMSGGMNWGELSNLLLKADWSNGVAMIFFIFFTMFAVLNIITGIFVDTALNTAMDDKEEVVHEYLTADDSTLKRLKEVFDSADVDQTGYLTYRQFVSMMNDKEIRALLASVGLTATKVSGLFKLMDLDNSGEVSVDEFLLQCMRLKGAAKSVDLMSLMYENKKMMNSFNSLTRFVTTEAVRSKGMQELIFSEIHLLMDKGCLSDGNAIDDIKCGCLPNGESFDDLKCSEASV